LDQCNQPCYISQAGFEGAWLLRLAHIMTFIT